MCTIKHPSLTLIGKGDISARFLSPLSSLLSTHAAQWYKGDEAAEASRQEDRAKPSAGRDLQRTPGEGACPSARAPWTGTGSPKEVVAVRKGVQEAGLTASWGSEDRFASRDHPALSHAAEGSL